VSVAEQRAALGQSVNIRGQRLGMSPEASNPIVQVIDRDKENIFGWFQGKRKSNAGPGDESHQDEQALREISGAQSRAHGL
jgi:hypothetical protein